MIDEDSDEANQELIASTRSLNLSSLLPLPLPAPRSFGSPFGGLLFGVIAAGAAGLALFAASQLIYIYIFFNSLAGTAVGKAIGTAPSKGRYDNKIVLLPATILCSILVYLSMNVFFCLYVFWSIPDLPQPGVADWPLAFWELLKLRAENETFIGGAQLGSVGNAIVWSVECLITFFVAWGIVVSQINALKVNRIPQEVLVFAITLLNGGASREEVSDKLASQGWVDPQDQADVFTAIQTIAASASSSAS